MVPTGQILLYKLSSLLSCPSSYRKEEDALSEALGETVADTDAEDEEEIQNDPWHKERFLDAYPRVKLELEGSIRKLHALADKVDKVHRDCTISRVVASSSSAVSGVLTILGLSLAPVTAGVSLALSATGLGLGAAATVTSVSTSIVEKVSVVSAEAKASKLVPTNKDTMKGMKEVLDQSGPRLLFLSMNSFKKLKNIKNNIHAIKLTKANQFNLPVLHPGSILPKERQRQSTGRSHGRQDTDLFCLCLIVGTGPGVHHSSNHSGWRTHYTH